MLKHRFVTCLLVIFFVLSMPTLVLAEMISVIGDNVNLRSGPGTNHAIKWRYGSGFPLKILEKQGEWLKVQDFENDTGWLHKDLASKEGHLVVKANKGTASRINIRSGPGTNHSIVGMAHYGVVFKTLNQQSGWAHVRHESGLEGWIERSLLWGF